jgi:hypothetical protein
MAHQGQDSIYIGDYLLERLSQLGVQASPSLLYLISHLKSTSSRYSVFPATSILVSISLISFLNITLTTDQDSWYVLVLFYMRPFLSMLAGSCREPP